MRRRVDDNMSYNQYSGYGGNPYGGEQQSYGASNPYSSEAGNPYGGGYEGQAVVSATQWRAQGDDVCMDARGERT